MAEKKIWVQEELTCKPLDTYEEILMFLQDPPPWRTLCKELKPHGGISIKNININKTPDNILLESPQTFCHFDPDAEDVKREDKKGLPKTLVCHDMANGYHDDSIIDGTGNYDAYTFYNWAGIDIFVYFSHHLITIPPLGWINVGHEHGVKVLGTVITEWGEGIAFWDRVLQTDAEAQNLASALVAIAKTLKFDGWLLNVENKISKPGALLRFVQHLHSTLHQELEAPVLIWYDSVTVDGHLNWQNGLNEKNKAFFDVVDGFFTNYSWRESDVEASVEAAGARVHDLYIGIDVWGRNFYGGGQFNTQEAVQLVHSHGCSLAIFAPAWTHEAMSDEAGDANAVAEADDLDKYERFLLRDRALWCSIWPYLNTRLACQMPFQTSFCRGQGKKRRLYGEVICPVPWYNLRHMQYQPNSALGPHGYLLSTADNIVRLSRYGLLKNREGILRYRRSVEESSLNISPEKSKEIVLSLKADSIGDMQEEVATENTVVTNEQASERKSVKRKVTRVLRHFFKVKPPKIEQNDEEEFDKEDHRPSTSAAQIRGRSMVQMSVNIRLGQKTLKTRYALGYVPNELECLEPFYEDSFIGGSCLKINPSDQVSQEHRLSRLFHSDFRVNQSLIVCVVTKTLPGHENQFLNVLLHVESGGKHTKVVLVGRSIPHGHEGLSGAEVVIEYPVREPGGGGLGRLQEYLLLHQPGFYVPVENAYGWRVRYYELDIPNACVTSINLRTGLDVGPVLLGHFGLCEKKYNRQ